MTSVQEEGGRSRKERDGVDASRWTPRFKGSVGIEGRGSLWTRRQQRIEQHEVKEIYIRYFVTTRILCIYVFLSGETMSLFLHQCDGFRAGLTVQVRGPRSSESILLDRMYSILAICFM